MVTICTAQWPLYVPHSGHYIYRTVTTICTAQWPLHVPHSGHYIYRTVVSICTAQWSLYVPHSGHYMYRQFNIQQFYVLPTQLYLTTNSHYFPPRHFLWTAISTRCFPVFTFVLTLSHRQLLARRETLFAKKNSTPQACSQSCASVFNTRDGSSPDGSTIVSSLHNRHAVCSLRGTDCIF